MKVIIYYATIIVMSYMKQSNVIIIYVLYIIITLNNFTIDSDTLLSYVFSSVQVPIIK